MTAEAGAIEVRKMTLDRLPKLAGVLGRAFANDPIHTWPLPPGADHVELGTRYFRELNERFVDLGWVWEAGDGLGAAMWIPPGGMQSFEELFSEFTSGIIQLMTDNGAKHETLWEWIEFRVPTEPLWFLDHIGVDPSAQGRGIGTALVEQGLARSSEDGVAAFLETGVLHNVPFYEKFGFEVVDEGDAPGGGPHIWFMRCDP